jgi:hypothetical protein
MVKHEDSARPASRFYKFIEEVISSATAGQKGQWNHSAVSCPKKPGHHKCPGHILVWEMSDDDIEWKCPACGIQGTIRGWQGSWANLSDLRLPDKQPGFEILLSEREYRDLKKRLVMEPGVDNIIYRATWSKEGILLRVIFTEMQGFADILDYAVDCEEKPARIIIKVLDCIKAIQGKWSSS